MRVILLLIPGLLMAAEIRAQETGQVPIFRNKKDSIDFAQLEAVLETITRKAAAIQNFGTIDSTYRVRRKFLEGKDFFYRWKFRQDGSYTPYQQLRFIANKDSITRISVLGNGRRRLPDSIYRYKNLKNLELIDFKLRRLPRKLKVQVLVIYNNFPSKPLKLSKNKTIGLLTIRGDEQGMLPKKYNKLKNLHTLTLSRNNLKVFPNIEGCTELRALNLNNNSICAIDPAIAQLPLLENLSLYKNEVKEIPEVMYAMHSLRVIDLYYNHISKVSPAMKNWKNLEILYLSNNEMYSIPNEIGELSSLRELYLHHNKLSNLPASIGNLTNLSVLRINNNSMIEWPRGLSHLTGLTNFDCSSNSFESLPINELDFRNMKILSIGNNPWDPELRANIKAWVSSLRANETVVHVDNNLAQP